MLSGLLWIVKRKMTEAAVAEVRAVLFQFDPVSLRGSLKAQWSLQLQFSFNGHLAMDL